MENVNVEEVINHRELDRPSQIQTEAGPYTMENSDTTAIHRAQNTAKDTSKAMLLESILT